MDDIQKKLVQMIADQPSCINERKILRAVLMDYLPQNKLQQNLMLNAYDEEVVECLKTSDVTLQALRMVKLLSDNYGITKENAVWVVCSWCYMLKLQEIAEIIESTAVLTQPKLIPQMTPMKPSQTVKIGLGIYRAGVDIPSGDLKIVSDQKCKTEVWYAVSKKPNNIETHENFVDQTYIRINDGNYLKIETIGSDIHYTFTVSQL